jgi:deoxyinosine 3'endonuclease (endonuclease V)
LAPTLELFKKLKAEKPHLWPEVVLVDGNGIVHQKKCGYASHLGVILKVPTIGCAKTFFDVDGLHQSEVEDMLYDKLKYEGEHMRLKGKSGKEWCTAVFSDAKSDKNLYINIGNMISLDSA